MALFANIKDKVKTLREKSLVWKIVLNKYVIATIVFLIVIGFLDRNNSIVLFRSLNTISDQNRQKLYYRNATDATTDKINQLTSNADTLEMFAREQYYFQKDSEVIYLLEFEDEN
ncbi:MAG: septum formation initiator family protein [Bacteroidales bacterium]|nr:septum formation initiator family protein [Bacteroidales bacterium]